MIPRIDRRLCNQSITLKIPIGEFGPRIKSVQVK